MTKIIYMDESGFTGANLLDPQQPFFVVASADIPEDQSKKILKASFPGYQGDEFKFQNIWKSGRGRKGLVKFASHLNDLGNNTLAQTKKSTLPQMKHALKMKWLRWLLCTHDIYQRVNFPRIFCALSG